MFQTIITTRYRTTTLMDIDVLKLSWLRLWLLTLAKLISHSLDTPFSPGHQICHKTVQQSSLRTLPARRAVESKMVSVEPATLDGRFLSSSITTLRTASMGIKPNACASMKVVLAWDRSSDRNPKECQTSSITHNTVWQSEAVTWAHCLYL